MSKDGSSPPLPRTPRRNGIAVRRAVEPVAPLVIDADMLGRVPGRLAPHQRAAMGAAVDEGLDLAVAVAVDDDRRVADPGGAKVAGIGDFRVEDQIAPCRAAEDRLLLAGVKLGVVIKPVRHPAVVVPRPDRGVDHYHSVLRSRYSILRRFDLGDKCLHSGPGSAGRPGTTRIVGFQTESRPRPRGPRQSRSAASTRSKLSRRGPVATTRRPRAIPTRSRATSPTAGLPRPPSRVRGEPSGDSVVIAGATTQSFRPETTSGGARCRPR